MPNKQYGNWEELTVAADKKCSSILESKVARVAKDIVYEHIISDIYEAYTPKPNGWVGGKTYKRRNLLRRKSNIYHKRISDNEILITSNVPASKSVVKGWSFRNRYEGAFLKMLESGNPGIWRGGFARPAISNAQKEIEKSTQIKQMIQAELNK